MAKNRIINTKFWTDPFVLDELNPIDKLVFLYLLTNPYTDISGVYELPIKVMAVETGVDRDNLERVILPRFEAAGKLKYKNGWVAMKNFIKHQAINPKVERGIEIGLNKAPKEMCDFVAYPIDSLSHSNPNSNPNTKKENVKNVFTSEEDVVFSPTDGDGEELLARPAKKPKGERKNEVAMRIQRKFADLCEKAVGVRPIIDVKGYVAALYALNTGGLTEKQIYDLFDDWFGSDKADDLRMSINAALSARSINAFKLTI